MPGAVAAPASATSATTFAGYGTDFPGAGTVTATPKVAPGPPVFTTSEVLSEVGVGDSGLATLTFDSSDDRVLYQAQIGSQAFDVRAGDTITVSITADASKRAWTGKITDVTGNRSISARRSTRRQRWTGEREAFARRSGSAQARESRPQRRRPWRATRARGRPPVSAVVTPGEV